MLEKHERSIVSAATFAFRRCEGASLQTLTPTCHTAPGCALLLSLHGPCWGAAGHTSAHLPLVTTAGKLLLHFLCHPKLDFIFLFNALYKRKAVSTFQPQMQRKVPIGAEGLEGTLSLETERSICQTPHLGSPRKVLSPPSSSHN